MNEPKFTPGPWAISKIANDYEQYAVYSEATNENVCNSVEGKPNARLIAAAPDLLEALQKALEQIESGEGVEAWRIIEAIHQATQP